MMRKIGDVFIIDYSYDYGYSLNMPVVSKGVLKAKMLHYFREVEKTGAELIVTDNSRPVLKVVPIRQKKSFDDLFSDLKGKIKYSEPVTKPTAGYWGNLK